MLPQFLKHLSFRTINSSIRALVSVNISVFENIVGSDFVLSNSNETSDDDLESFNFEFTKVSHGCAQVVILPKTEDEIRGIIDYCNKEEIKVVPQGGNTGLVGGGMAMEENEVIISLKRMNSIKEFDEESGVVVCEPGVVLEGLDMWLRERGFMSPLDLGSSGSCFVGGNVATNAGGIR